MIFHASLISTLSVDNFFSLRFCKMFILFCHLKWSVKNAKKVPTKPQVMDGDAIIKPKNNTSEYYRLWVQSRRDKYHAIIYTKLKV